MVEVILKKDIYRLGDRGNVVRVAAGYARNYLYPQQLAIPADKGTLKQLGGMRAAAARDAVRMRGDAEKQAEALEGAVIRVVARASLNNQLYGSVTARDVAAKLAEQGIEIDRHRIELKTPLRSVGDYEVPVHIYKDLSSTVKVEVRAEGREDEPVDVAKELAPEFDFAPAPKEDAEAATGTEEAEAATAEGATDPAEAAAEGADPQTETEATAEAEVTAVADGEATSIAE